MNELHLVFFYTLLGGNENNLIGETYWLKIHDFYIYKYPKMVINRYIESSTMEGEIENDLISPLIIIF
jgi:hypothetical protein